MLREVSTEWKLLPPTLLLITESKDEFDRFREAFIREINPRGIIEHMYVADLAYLFWEILRYRRCIAAIINTRFLPALAHLIRSLSLLPDMLEETAKEEADGLALQWFANKKAKTQILDLLGKFQLDESTIEAEAIRSSVAELEKFERLLASAEARRNKALRCVGEYRANLARILRETGDQIIENKVSRRRIRIP